MKSYLAKKTSITLPPKLERELQSQAKSEQKSLSGILQEAARYYLNIKKWESLQQELALKARYMGIQNEKDVDHLIHELRP